MSENKINKRLSVKAKQSTSKGIKKSTLSFKIILITLLFLACLIAINLFFSNSINNEIKQIVENESNKYVTSINNIFDKYLTVSEQSNHFIFIKQFLTNVTSKDELNNNYEFEVTVNALKSIKNSSEFIRSVWVADPKGKFVFFDTGKVEDLNISDEENLFYRQLSENKTAFVSEPYTLGTDKTNYVSFINPLYSEGGVLIGLFGLGFNNEHFNDYALKLIDNDNDFLKLITNNNNVIFNIKGRYKAENDDDAFSEEVNNALINKEAGTYHYFANNSEFFTTIKETIVPGWRLVFSNTRSTYISRVSNLFNVAQWLLIAFCFASYIAGLIWVIMSSLSKLKSQLELRTDRLTNALNMTGFEEIAENIIKQVNKQEYVYVLIKIFDLNILNQMLGTEAGDELIVHIASALQRNVSTDEYFCRASGARFALLLKFDGMENMLNRLKHINSDATDFHNEAISHFVIQLAFGCYVIKDSSEAFEEINSNVELVLTKCSKKDTYESIYMFYDDKIKREFEYSKILENNMEQAILENQFIIHYQGKYDVKTSRISSAEALVRWNHPELGLIPPGKFISLFESNGFILKLDMYVFETVCEQIRGWIDKGITVVPIAVNLSRRNLENKNVVHEILGIIDKYNIPKVLIELELTESAVSNDSQFLTELLRQFDENGISVAIDDFGAGYSTLNTLKELTVSTLKVDREFFNDLQTNERGKAVIKNIITMAKELNLKTVSEGIETEEQVEFIKQVGGDLIQGYFFSKPVPIEDFEVLLVNNDKQSASTF